MFEKFLKRTSWTDIIISIIFVIFGILLIVKPEETYGAISIIFGVVVIAMGILKLVEYYTSETKEDYLLTMALIAVIFGVIIIFAADSILSFFRVILGIWIIAVGISDLQTILMWREVKSGYWTLALLSSFFVITSGIIILVYQNLLPSIMGVAIVVYAITDIIDKSIFISKIKKFEKATK